MDTTTRTDELTGSLLSDVAMIQRLVTPLLSEGKPSLDDVEAIIKAMYLLRVDASAALRTALDLCYEMNR